MANCLIITLPIKKEPGIYAKLCAFERDFQQKYQARLEQTMNAFARFTYLALTASPQTITIVGFYHGDIRSYGEFLRKELYEPFSSLFEVCENPPNINDPDAVYAFFMQHNSPPLNNYVYERGDLDPQVRGLRGNHPEPRH